MSQLSLNNTSEEQELSTEDVDVRPFKIIKRKSGWQSLDLRELWGFRDLLLMLAMRDIRLRYKQTALGVAWVVLQPLIAAGIFSFVFGQVAKLPTDGIPPFVFSFASLLGWNLFATTLSKVSSSLINNAHLVTKVYFPRLVIPLSTIFSSLLDFAVALVMLAAILCYNHIVPSPGLFLLPVWILLILLLATGFGLYASCLSVTYRDIQYILPVAIQFLLYASPIAYAITAVPGKWRAIYLLNPLAILLEGFRWSLLNRGYMHPGLIAYAALAATGLAFLGAFAFRRMERRFADVI